MALDTYANLKTAIADHLDDASLTSYLDDFIDLAEATINRRVRIQEMQKRATASTGTADRFLATPANFAEMVSLRLNSDPLHGIEYVTNNQIDDFYNSTAGKPAYYTVWGDELEFNRKCDSDYTIEMKYFQKVTALSGSNTSNDVLTYHPDIYLYGSLVAATPFIAEDSRLPTWGGLLEKAISEANLYAQRSQQSGSPLRRRGRGLTP